MLSRNFGWVKMPRPQANFLWIDWPISRATPLLLSNSPLLGTAHPTEAISCPIGNYIIAQGWKFCLLSRLDLSKSLIFLSRGRMPMVTLPPAQKIILVIIHYVPKLWGELWLDGKFCFQTQCLKWPHCFPTAPEKKKLMLIFSRENLGCAPNALSFTCVVQEFLTSLM